MKLLSFVFVAALAAMANAAAVEVEGLFNPHHPSPPNWLVLTNPVLGRDVECSIDSDCPPGQTCHYGFGPRAYTWCA